MTVRQPADTQLGTDRVPAVVSRLHRAVRVREGHLHAPARVRAGDAVHLQRSRLHAAGIHPRGRRAAAHAAGPTAPSIRHAALAAQFSRLRSFLTPDPLTFNPPRAWRPNCAPTEVDRWRGRLLTGEVHDENCWALGGAAGHAGLFGTVAAVGSFARAVLRTIAGEADSRGSGDDARATSSGSRFPEAHARSAGTRCCRRRPAER